MQPSGGRSRFLLVPAAPARPRPAARPAPPPPRPAPAPAPRAAEAQPAPADPLPVDPPAEPPPGATPVPAPVAVSPAVLETVVADPAGAELDRKLEAAVAKGLGFLKANQRAEGVWGKSGTEYGDYVYPITALGGLAMLANSDERNTQGFPVPIDSACRYLLSGRNGNGYISNASKGMFGHAFACLLFAECCEREKDWQWKEDARNAITLCLANQGKDGGWGYEPAVDDSEIVVSLCVLQALQAGRSAGIEIDLQKIQSAETYVLRHKTSLEIQDIEPSCGLFFYFPGASSKAMMKLASYPITAQAMALLLPRFAPDDPLVLRCSKYLLDERPRVAQRNSSGLGEDCLSIFYSTLYFVSLGGEAWRIWKQTALTELLGVQAADGSWGEKSFYGQAFATSLAILSLSAGKKRLTIFRDRKKE